MAQDNRQVSCINHRVGLFGNDEGPHPCGVGAFASDHITVEVAGIEPASNVVL